MNTPSCCIVVAMSHNRVIGLQGRMPWHLPRDLAHFKQITLGHAVVMGRKTWDSIITQLGHPLFERTSYVISRHADKIPCTQDTRHRVIACSDFKTALLSAQIPPQDPWLIYTKNPTAHRIFVIGGGQIYEQALPLVTTIHMTLVEHTCEGDTFFPCLDPDTWQEVQRKSFLADDKNAYAHTFIEYHRRHTT